MRILFLGDIVGKKTVEYLSKNLWALRREKKIDAVIANGENATDIMGLSSEDATALLDSGVDRIVRGKLGLRAEVTNVVILLGEGRGYDLRLDLGVEFLPSQFARRRSRAGSHSSGCKR